MASKKPALARRQSTQSFGSTSKSSAAVVVSADECVKVAVRLRPFNEREQSGEAESVVKMFGEATSIADPKGERPEHTFTYDFSMNSTDKALPAYISQERVFAHLGQPLVAHAWNGYNCSIFAYGQTGSGKSYSMMGYGQDKGIIPRCCEELFQRIQSATGTPDLAESSVEVSYLEIYNESIRDLLTPDIAGSSAGLQIRENPQLGVYVAGLSQILVKNYADIERTINDGNACRTVARTKMNDTSSRSHSVFTIYFTKTKATGAGRETTYSKISLIDLAGSERQKQTQAEGDRLKEACAINKSLSALGNVINVLAENSQRSAAKFIPYRDSVLTRLLQESLGGNAKTVMIATISPSSLNYDETVSTLKYANRAKQIVNRATRNEEIKAAAVESLQAEIQRLRALLESGPTGGGGGGGDDDDESSSEAVKARLRENEELIAELSMTIAEKERRTAEIHAMRESALEDMGISFEELTGAFGVDKSTPYLVNLNADPMMSENLVYFLKAGTTRVGKLVDPGSSAVALGFTAAKPDIALGGFNVQPAHCELVLDERGAVTLVPIAGAKTFVNGVQVVEPVAVATGARIIIGNNHIFRFTSPRDAAAAAALGRTASTDHDWEFAMRELMIARGQAPDLDPTSEAGTILRLVEATDEANDISELLEKKMIFSVELHDDESTGKRVVGIRATNMLTDSTRLWNVEKFDVRFAIIQARMETYMRSGRWADSQEDDPFYDPPSDELIGVAVVPTAPLARSGVLAGNFPIRAGKLKETRGELSVALSIIGAANGAQYDRALLGSEVDVRVEVSAVTGLTSLLHCGVCAKFNFPEDAEQVTERVTAATADGRNGSYDIALGYSESFRMTLTKELVVAFERGSLSFSVYGHEDVAARDPDALQALLDRRETELETMRRNFALVNAQQTAEIASLRARVGDLEANAYNLIRDDVADFRQKKARFEATLKTLFHTLPTFQTQMTALVAQSMPPAAGAASSSAAPMGSPPQASSKRGTPTRR